MLDAINQVQLQQDIVKGMLEASKSDLERTSSHLTDAGNAFSEWVEQISNVRRAMQEMDKSLEQQTSTLLVPNAASKSNRVKLISDWGLDIALSRYQQLASTTEERLQDVAEDQEAISKSKVKDLVSTYPEAPALCVIRIDIAYTSSQHITSLTGFFEKLDWACLTSNR